MMKNNPSNQPRSDCHQALMRVSTADEGTAFYLCTECGAPCDLYVADHTQPNQKPTKDISKVGATDSSITDVHPQPVVGDDELVKAVGTPLFKFGMIIREVCGKEVGNTLIDKLEPIEKELLTNVKQLVQADKSAAVHAAEKRAEVRWKREHDYWKTLAESFLKREQLKVPEKMYICDNTLCSSLHTAEELTRLQPPTAGEGESV